MSKNMPKITDFYEQCEEIMKELGGNVPYSETENNVTNTTETPIHRIGGTVETYRWQTKQQLQHQQQIQIKVKEQVKQIEKNLNEPHLVYKKLGGTNFPSFVMEAPWATSTKEMREFEHCRVLDRPPRY